jgi:hypothetical protein
MEQYFGVEVVSAKKDTRRGSANTRRSNNGQSRIAREPPFSRQRLSN